VYPLSTKVLGLQGAAADHHGQYGAIAKLSVPGTLAYLSERC
jgi:hypothetical protein